MYKTLTAPVMVQWELTSACNYMCLHCYNYWRTGGANVERSGIENSYQAVCQELIKNKVFYVTLTGGEPLLVLEEAMPFLRSLREEGIDLAINSNLSLLTVEKAELLKELEIRGVLTSLMAADPGLNNYLAQNHNAWQQTIDGINLAVESGLDVTVNMVVSKLNVNWIYETAKLAVKQGARVFTATKAAKPLNCSDFSSLRLSQQEFAEMQTQLVRVKDDLKVNTDSLEAYPKCAFVSSDFMDLVGARRCLAGKNSCTIGFDGQVRPCSHAHVTYGHIEKGLQKAWLNMEEWRSIELIPKNCQSCSGFPGQCLGGCRIEAYLETGSLDGKDPYCLSEPPSFEISRKPAIEISEEDYWTFNSEVRYRREEFGALLYLDSRNWLPIDENLLTILIESEKRPFTSRGLAKAMDVEKSSATATVSLLTQKNLLDRGKEVISHESGK